MTPPREDDDAQEQSQLRDVARQSVQSISVARQRAEEELRKAKEALEEETRVLELLNATGAKLASNLDLQTLLQAVTDAGATLSGAQYGAFFYAVTGPDGDAWTLYTLSGAPREAFARFSDPRATPLFGPAFRGEGVIRIANVHEDARYGQWAPDDGTPSEHFAVCSYLAVPVVSRAGEVLGGLLFGHAEPGVFTDRSERLVTGIASQAAIAIDNARLYEAAKRAAEERAQLLEIERAARGEAERVSVLKDEFLATLSHELRTPLNAILGWGRILLDSTKDARPELTNALETIVRNALAQARLIEDLLDMSRIISGKIRLDVQPVELELIVLAAVDAVRPTAEAKDIRIRTTIESSRGAVFADPNRLQQVVWNLLTNAVKFTARGGKVDVIVHRVNSHFEIVVQDDGIGIPAEFLPHLFERFRQADGSSTRRYGGLGIGLSIAKQLVELHGGSIRAESEGEGKGATLIVSLPLRAAYEANGRRHPNTPSAPQLHDGTVSLAELVVLVVDDDADARELLRSLLVDAQAKVLTASSADEALELVVSQQPDVLVSDIGMPDRDGYSLIRAVRELPAEAGGRTPAIAVTAFARSADRTRAMLAGYQVHLSKPVEPEELVATIRSVAMTSTRPK